MDYIYIILLSGLDPNRVNTPVSVFVSTMRNFMKSFNVQKRAQRVYLRQNCEMFKNEKKNHHKVLMLYKYSLVKI